MKRLFFTQTWTQVDHRIHHFVGRRFDELLVSLFEPIHFLWVHFLCHERVSTSPVQTHIGIGGKTFLLSVSIDFTLIYLNDIFHSFQSIVHSECLCGSSVLVSEEEGVHYYSITSILYKKLVIHQDSPIFSFFK